MVAGNMEESCWGRPPSDLPRCHLGLGVRCQPQPRLAGSPARTRTEQGPADKRMEGNTHQWSHTGDALVLSHPQLHFSQQGLQCCDVIGEIQAWPLLHSWPWHLDRSHASSHAHHAIGASCRERTWTPCLSLTSGSKLSTFIWGCSQVWTLGTDGVASWVIV